MLYMVGLDVLGVARHEWQILVFFILQTDFPAIEQFGARLHIFKPWVLEWSLELSAHDVLEAIV